MTQLTPHPEEIFLQATPFEARAVRLIQGVVQEIEVERTLQRGAVGNIVMGKVSRVLPGMQAAFIDAGFARTGFLHVADVWQAKLLDGERLETPRPIEKVLYDSQQFLVQVLKDPVGSKGARLSTQLSIAGRYLVYLPYDTKPDPTSNEPRVGISQRIEDPEAREALKARLLALIPSDEHGSFIARTQAEDASQDALANDIQYLKQRWNEILAASKSATPGTVLYRELNLAQRVLRDWVGDRTTRVLVDDPYRIDGLRSFAQQYMPSVMPRIENFVGERPLFELHNIEQEITSALKRRVDLKSGGYLIIDHTEAMTTIDVNTGGYVSGRSFSDTIFKTNLEAAQAIARQLRLRNIGGIILVDFIDMQDEDHRTQVHQELAHALEDDRTKVRISGFTSLGLVELTRKRTRDSLAQQLMQTCPTCDGQGRIKTAQTTCYEILREIARMAHQFNPKEFRILAGPEIIERFLEEEAAFLNALIDEVGKPITLSVEGEYPPGGYDIALL
ncbi:MAG: Rne/Rng family ribonuclease [Burkholderiaceae bacterium]